MISSKLINNEILHVVRIMNNGEYDPKDGFPKKAIKKSFNIKANVQPLSGKELLQVEEGDRERNNFNVFTETKLTPDDIITRNGIEFEVRLAEDWNQLNLKHFFARIVQKDV